MRINEHPIIDFRKGKTVKFNFEGRKLIGYAGETIASALHAAGVKVLSHSGKMKRPRGFFCAIGNCSSCLMMVNGVSNVRICITIVKEGDVVERQQGKGEIVEKD
ncbi:MAG: (2Fe-2S)-binding protein [Bacillota bacterium]